MVGPVALALLALAQPAGEAPAAQGCALVAPNGDPISFQMISWNAAGDEVGLLAKSETVWPTRTLVGERSGTGTNLFVFGGENGLVLQLGEAGREGVRTAALRRREGNRMGLPLAYGYCRPEPRYTVFRPLDTAAAPADIGADIATFDPARWRSQECALLTRDGRRAWLSYRLLDPRRLEVGSAGLWNGRRVTVERRQGEARRGLPSVASFGRAGGPSGVEALHVDAASNRGVKLISFRDLGDGSGTARAGFAICGYRNLVRTSVQEL